jgi:hypothetical protein
MDTNEQSAMINPARRNGAMVDARKISFDSDDNERSDKER